MQSICWIWRLLRHGMLPESGTKNTLQVSLLLLCIVIFAYANSFAGVFQFDDFNVIVNNPRVHAWPVWWRDLQHGIRPLLKFTYTVDWTAGLGVTGYHLTNMLIHFCNSLLVWALSRHFLEMHSASHGLKILPILTAILFAIHPVHTEAVSYICGRSSALMSLFYLAGLLLYIFGKANQSKLYLHVLVPLCMLLALGVKETAVTFPAGLLLWELYHGGSIKSALRQQWSSWLLLLASAIFFLLHDGYGSMMQHSVHLNSFVGNIATQLLALVYLLRQWFLPLWLNIDPDLPLLQGFAGMAPHLVILTVLIGTMLWSRRQRPWLSFALAWMLLHLIPLYLVLPRMDVANDRQLYLASWPLALALLVEMSLWLQQKAFFWSTAFLFIILLSLTVLRNQQFHTEIALWEATVKLSPDKARVQNNLGYAYMMSGRNDEARLALTQALRLDPEYFQARFNLQKLTSLDRSSVFEPK